MGHRNFKVLALSALLLLGVSGAAEAGIVRKIKEKVDIYRQLSIFSDVLSLIQKAYVEPVDVKNLIYNAIRGMFYELDPYSVFMEPDEYQEFLGDTEGKFGGIGIQIGMRDGFLTVISPIEGSPAWKAGIKAGDKIVNIDGEITQGITLNEAVSKIRGVPGTKVKLSLLRKDVDHLIEIQIERDIIQIDEITFADIIDADTGIACIRITKFNDDMIKDIDKAIYELEKKGMKALIIDIRNNPGGMLISAVDLCGRFLPKGSEIVYTKGRIEDERHYKTDFSKPLLDLPIVVLINEGSASASEIFAGALQYYGRAVIVGEKTFGKGVVQQIFPLSDGSAVKMTTEKYYLPDGRCIDGEGIKPDVEAEHKYMLTEKEMADMLKGGMDVNKVFDIIKRGDKLLESEEKGNVTGQEIKYDYQVQEAISLLKTLLLTSKRRHSVKA